VNHLPQSPRIYKKFKEIFAIEGAPPISTALVPNKVHWWQFANFATLTTGVVENCGKIATAVNNTSVKFATAVNDTSGKFAAGVHDTCGKLPPVSTTPAANFPLLSNNGNNIRLLTS